MGGVLRSWRVHATWYVYIAQLLLVLYYKYKKIVKKKQQLFV